MVAFGTTSACRRASPRVSSLRENTGAESERATQERLRSGQLLREPRGPWAQATSLGGQDCGTSQVIATQVYCTRHVLGKGFLFGFVFLTFTLIGAKRTTCVFIRLGQKFVCLQTTCKPPSEGSHLLQR